MHCDLLCIPLLIIALRHSLRLTSPLTPHTESRKDERNMPHSTHTSRSSHSHSHSGSGSNHLQIKCNCGLITLRFRPHGGTAICRELSISPAGVPERSLLDRQERFPS